MRTFRTTGCRAHGHPEITLQLAGPSPIPDAHRVLCSYFEGAVARGTKFLPGQRVQFGWSTLLLCERPDGTIGLQERELTPEVQWTEAVDNALRDLWFQRAIADSVGLLEELTFPRQDHVMMMAACAEDAEALLLTRLPHDPELPEDFSGWTLCCAADHDHGARRMLPLLALAANQGGLVQLLALPHGVTAFVQWSMKPDAPVGALRIEPRLFREGAELVPVAGSYLASLQA